MSISSENVMIVLLVSRSSTRNKHRIMTVLDSLRMALCNYELPKKVISCDKGFELQYMKYFSEDIASVLLIRKYQPFSPPRTSLTIIFNQECFRIYYTSRRATKWFIRHVQHSHHFYQLTQIVS